MRITPGVLFQLNEGARWGERPLSSRVGPRCSGLQPSAPNGALRATQLLRAANATSRSG